MGCFGNLLQRWKGDEVSRGQSQTANKALSRNGMTWRESEKEVLLSRDDLSGLFSLFCPFCFSLSIRFGFIPHQQLRKRAYDVLDQYLFPSQLDLVFAFSHSLRITLPVAFFSSL
jgi:hypothetical protein